MVKLTNHKKVLRFTLEKFILNNFTAQYRLSRDTSFRPLTHLCSSFTKIVKLESNISLLNKIAPNFLGATLYSNYQISSFR